MTIHKLIRIFLIIIFIACAAITIYGSLNMVHDENGSCYDRYGSLIKNQVCVTDKLPDYAAFTFLGTFLSVILIGFDISLNYFLEIIRGYH